MCKKITAARKKRLIAALEKQTLLPYEIAEKAGLSVESLADMAKEHWGITDPDIAAQDVFELFKIAPQDNLSENRQNSTQKNKQRVNNQLHSISKHFSPAAKGRAVAALKSSKHTPQEIADQAGISIETLADWTKTCMGLVGDNLTPADVFHLFLYRKTPAAPQQFRESHPQTQLCWNCIHAVPNGKLGCSWSKSFTPVDGWQAEKTSISYRIIRCPLFERG